jgi:SAM-dependent methyltransferase
LPQGIFDLERHQYNAMLAKGLRLSGEERHFFIRGRVLDLAAHLPPGFTLRRILDFGCGTGETAHFLAETFSDANVVGVDDSEKALAEAEANFGSPRITFSSIPGKDPVENFDLCYVNGVFHHIEPENRVEIIHSIHDVLAAGGLLAFFENNPWNPGTRLVMKRIPFDRDAQMLNPPQARDLIRRGGFSRCLHTRFLFYMPHFLGFLRFAEPWLARLPLGAQYYVLAAK